MQITELNVTMWPQPRRDGAAVPAVAPPPAPQPDSVASLNLLDADRDGWLDEDAVPYDQLMLLQRERADAAKPPPDPAPPEDPAAASTDPAASHVGDTPAVRPQAPPHIDLLA
jgi:hypothetical protein